MNRSGCRFSSGDGGARCVTWAEGKSEGGEAARTLEDWRRLFVLAALLVAARGGWRTEWLGRQGGVGLGVDEGEVGIRTLGWAMGTRTRMGMEMGMGTETEDGDKV